MAAGPAPELVVDAPALVPLAAQDVEPAGGPDLFGLAGAHRLELGLDLLQLGGTFVGREALYEWISETMAQWPNSEMKEFPHDWCICDEERGWWVCQIENRFVDPGDGEVYQAYNLTVLKYAGDGLFSSEEDAYNPANFAPVVKAWIAAKRRADAAI